LLALRLVTGRHWRALFRRFRIRDLAMMGLFGCGTWHCQVVFEVWAEAACDVSGDNIFGHACP
jgi:hypothetical protein